MPTRLFDKAGFWVQVGALVAALGGAGIVVGVSDLAPHQSWREPWFALGAVVLFFGVLALWWSVTLYVAHHYAERHPLIPPSPIQQTEAPGAADAGTPLDRLQALQGETGALHEAIRNAYGPTAHRAVYSRILAWALLVEAQLQPLDTTLWTDFRTAWEPPPQLLDRNQPAPQGMTDDQWAKNFDFTDSNLLRGFLHRKEAALGRAIGSLQ